MTSEEIVITNTIIDLAKQLKVEVDKLCTRGACCWCPLDVIEDCKNYIELSELKQLVDKRKGKDIVTNQILKEHDNFNKCPNCSGELHGTYEISREAKDGEDPRIYGVVCCDCSYENYD